MSMHLTLPHELRGRSDRECQDLRLGRLGVPRPARIAARLTLCPRDLPGLRIRLTTVPCILPERLELTWCHRGTCRRDRLIIVPWFRQFAARVDCVAPETCQGIDGYDRGTNRWYFQRILSFLLFKDDFQRFYIGFLVFAQLYLYIFILLYQFLIPPGSDIFVYLIDYVSLFISILIHAYRIFYIEI